MADGGELGGLGGRGRGGRGEEGVELGDEDPAEVLADSGLAGAVGEGELLELGAALDEAIDLAVGDGAVR